MRSKLAFFGSIPLYIGVQGLNSPPFDYRPQYIVVGNVDKTFLDYIITAKTKRPPAALCGISYPKKIFFFHIITFFAGQEESYYEKPY